MSLKSAAYNVIGKYFVQFNVHQVQPQMKRSK
ncbi:hypothetical protein T07_7104 [Trichinella nelsoni]|uniref:Uncharacterized protein n=1 Tax=Trichinella nelsoni TaxID=6336 RepID=A0A0V0RD29_9BILA|nr:hypothetical protein T07_7104 [Trichinella nelsoni]